MTVILGIMIRTFAEGNSKRILLRVLLAVGIVAGVILSFPPILAFGVQHREKQAIEVMSVQFPVTVNPAKKTITEDPRVNAYLESNRSPLQAAVGNLEEVITTVFTWIAVAIADASWYQSVAAVTVGGDRFVLITSGMRKEQVANAFAKALTWDAKQKKEFLNTTSSAPLEGSFAPGVYAVPADATPAMAHALINERFAQEVLARYSSETAEIVPLHQALTIASLIEREAGGADDMRIISGIIWNRLFINMRLQIDATLQYAKANTAAAQSWWPGVVPADRFHVSPYNTYMHAGLPPGPIANPSVATILAALNPKETSCLFYFHDDARKFHCSDTYAGHVALLKKLYGRGK